MLVFDQSGTRGPFYYEIFSALRSTVKAHPGPPVSIWFEQLDLRRFPDSSYQQRLQQIFLDKYRDKPIGVVVAIGSASLDYMLRFRSTLWSDVPVVFSMVDETTASRLLPSAGVTGSIMKLRFADMITTARAVVPRLGRIALVGDAWERQNIYRHWKDEVPIASSGLEVIDLRGWTLRELKRRLASLPDDAAILYMSIYSDGEGTDYPPIDALQSVAETANRPIVVASEAYLGYGAIGGFLIVPSQIGTAAAQLAMRILAGESASSIPVSIGNMVRPIFDWRQMQRWGVSASSLPSGSEIRFREPTLWQQYRSQILVVCAAILMQTMMIGWLIYEHWRRRLAEVLSRNSMAELAQMNRLATAGELSAAIAHEVKQPVTGMVTSANAALRWLSRDNPDIARARDALGKVVTAGYRAGDIIANVRAMFGKDTQENIPTDVNKLIRTVLGLVYFDLRKHGIESQVNLDEELPPIIGNAVQLQQVIFNLIMNAIESMNAAVPRVLSIKSVSTDRDTVLVSVADTGSGIDLADIDRVFKPMFTTKARGMGMGLSICKSVIESHNGRIWVSAAVPRGSIFHVELPVYQSDELRSDLSGRTPATLSGEPAPTPSMID
jgi:signal transduction histidine kinase